MKANILHSKQILIKARQQQYNMATSRPNPNLETFDKAVALIESTPRQFKDLPSGETISYREYNKGQPHTLVMLPGYVCDDALFSVRSSRRTLNTLYGYISLTHFHLFLYQLRYSNIDYCSTTRVSRPSHCCSEPTRVERFEHEHSNLFPRG